MIRTETDGAIGWLIIDRPGQRNALSTAMWADIPRAARTLCETDGVRAIILRGAGNTAFAAGADIGELQRMGSDPAALADFEEKFEAAQASLEACPLPVIAAIKGPCMGGGLALALCCDMRVAGGDASFAIPAARLGLGYCPEERAIMASLTCQENLMLPPQVRQGGLSLDAIFELFPNLKERLGSSQGTKLSGGEQQMLAIGRILRTGARLLLLDEPTEGLAPVIIQQIGKTIRTLKQQGFTILLVEQNVPLTLAASQRVYIMEKGTIRHQAVSSELKIDDPVIKQYLGV